MTAPQNPYYPPAEPAKKKRKKWPWILGGIILLFVASVGGCMALIGGAAVSVNNAITSASSEAATPTHVIYKVTGTSTSADITYEMAGNTTQDSSVTLPWTKETDVTGYFKYASVTATNGYEDNSTITCDVIVNGKTVFHNTASGPGASANCSGDVSK